MSIFTRIKMWWAYCRKFGHAWHWAGDSLIGEWIRCTRCNKLEEYVPGAHEPKGYVSKYRAKS